MKRFALALGIVLVVAACGGDSDENEVGEAVTVSSSDGKAQLTLVAGSLPDGIDAGDVQIEWAIGTSTEPGAPAVGVRLEPDGLVLNESALLRLELPDTVGDEFAVVHVSGDGFEFIDGGVEMADNRSFLVTSINHFSYVFMYNVEGVTTSIVSADPSVVGVGQSQLVKWEVWLEPRSFGLWIPTDLDGGKSRLWTFSEGQLSDDPSRFWGEARWWTEGRGSWDPDFVNPPPVLDDVLVSFAASSTCTKVNSNDPRVQARLTFSTTIKAKGEIVDTNFLKLAESLGQAAQFGTSERFEDGKSVPFDADIGQGFEAGFTVLDRIESECVASVETTTTSSTSSTSTTTTVASTTSVPAPGDPGADIVDGHAEEGSIRFTMEVAGDGQALAEDPDTKWYSLEYTVQHPDGIFVVDGKFSDTGFKGRVFDADFNLLVDADINGEWTDPSTAVITVDNIPFDWPIDSYEQYLDVRITNTDGSETTYVDSFVWQR